MRIKSLEYSEIERMHGKLKYRLPFNTFLISLLDSLLNEDEADAVIVTENGKQKYKFTNYKMRVVR